MAEPIKLAVPVNTSVLLNLADAQTAQVFTELGGELPTGVAAAVKKVQDERKEKAAEMAATEIVNLIEVANNFLQSQAELKVNALRQIESIDALAAKVKTAVSYGSSSSNYLPLSRLVGQSIPAGAKKELLTVPDGWTAPTPAAAAPAAA